MSPPSPPTPEDALAMLEELRNGPPPGPDVEDAEESSVLDFSVSSSSDSDTSSADSVSSDVQPVVRPDRAVKRRRQQ